MDGEGPSAKRPLMRAEDRLRAAVLLVFAIAGVALFLAVPALTDAPYMESSLALALPLVALGVLELASTRKWLVLVAMAAVSAAVALLDAMIGACAAVLLLGSAGIAALSDLVQRAVMLKVLESAEHLGVRPEPTPADRAVSFLFDLPMGQGSGRVRIEGKVRRESIPWRQIVRNLLPTLAVMLLVWVFAAAATFHWEGYDVLPVVVAGLYVAALTMSLNILSVLDARLETSGGTSRLSHGFRRTASRMAVVGIIALIAETVVGPSGWSVLWMIAASGAFVLAALLLAAYHYSTRGQPEFVEDIHGEWSHGHPEEASSAGAGRGLDDGVPGTPRRPADFCFRMQSQR